MTDFFIADKLCCEQTKPKTYIKPVFECVDDGRLKPHHIDVSILGLDTLKFVPLAHVSKQRRKIFELEDENAKLRELVRDMWRDIPKSESCGWDMDANCCTGCDECGGECSYWYRMRELGIEVG